MARDSYKWISYKKGFGCRWVVVNGGGYVLASGGWQWIYSGWLCVALGGGGWWWAVLDDGGWWWIYFGWWWLVVGTGGWWWVVVDIFWLVVGGAGWWWMVA